jgi:hypothetical protein
VQNKDSTCLSTSDWIVEVSKPSKKRQQHTQHCSTNTNKCKAKPETKATQAQKEREKMISGQSKSQDI